RFHLAAVDDQEHQDVDRAMPLVLELDLLDVARDGAADRHPLEDLKVGHLVGTNHPEATAGQGVSVSVPPQNLYCTVHELGIQPRRLPEAGAMRLQVNRVQDAADAALADGVDDAIGHSLACQVGAGPVGNVQPPGNGLQAGQFDDLRFLQ